MHLKNLWFHLPSLLGAAFFAAASVFSIVPNPLLPAPNLVVEVLVAGIFLALAVGCLRMSLQVGDMQRRLREQRKRDRQAASKQDATHQP